MNRRSFVKGSVAVAVSAAFPVAASAPVATDPLAAYIAELDAILFDLWGKHALRPDRMTVSPAVATMLRELA